VAGARTLGRQLADAAVVTVAAAVVSVSAVLPTALPAAAGVAAAVVMAAWTAASRAAMMAAVTAAMMAAVTAALMAAVAAAQVAAVAATAERQQAGGIGPPSFTSTDPEYTLQIRLALQSGRPLPDYDYRLQSCNYRVVNL
jgi:predicted membrane-bound mannosyltransferase